MLLILVQEQAGVSADVPDPGPMRRLKASTMWLPVLAFDDGYGFTYGARLSFVDVRGRRTRLSVPLTWRCERRASVEVERRFLSGGEQVGSSLPGWAACEATWRSRGIAACRGSWGASGS